MEVTFLLFPREVFLMQEVQSNCYDPKELMDTLLEVKEGIIKQFMRYRKADKTPEFRKGLTLELSRMSEEQRQNQELCTEILEHHLTKMEADQTI